MQRETNCPRSESPVNPAAGRMHGHHNCMVNPNRKPFFKELDHTADLGVEIYGQDVEDLFRNAVHALYVLLGFPETTDDTLVRSGQTLKVEGQDQEDALVRLLGDLLYRADVEKERFFPEKVFLRVPWPGPFGSSSLHFWQDPICHIYAFLLHLRS